MAWNWKRLLVGGMAIVVLGSCSGDGETAAPAASPTTTAPPPSTTLRPVDTSATGQSSSQFCAAAKTYSERSTGAERATTPDQLRAGVVEARSSIEQVVAMAPAEVKGDAQTLANGFSVLFTELEKVDFDPTRVSLAAFSALQVPEFALSALRFRTYIRTVCGID